MTDSRSSAIWSRLAWAKIRPCIPALAAAIWALAFPAEASSAFPSGNPAIDGRITSASTAELPAERKSSEGMVKFETMLARFPVIREMDGAVVASHGKPDGDLDDLTPLGQAFDLANLSDPQCLRVGNRLRQLALLSPDRVELDHAVEPIVSLAEISNLNLGKPDSDQILLQHFSRDQWIGGEIGPAPVAPYPALALPQTMSDTAAHVTSGNSSSLQSASLFQAAAQASNQVKQPIETVQEDFESIALHWRILEKLFYGLSSGSVLLLTALGLVITFRFVGVINMAHGEMLMIGAYAAVIVDDVFRAVLPGAIDFALLAALPTAFLAAATVGVAIERGLVRKLRYRPLETMLATWGLGLIFQQLARNAFGGSPLDAGNPAWMSGALNLGGGLVFSIDLIWIFFLSVLILLVLAMVFFRTAFGEHLRAIPNYQGAADSARMKLGRIKTLTFGLGSGIAGLGGVALSQIEGISPGVGQAYLVDSLLILVIGGTGSLLGTVLGAGGLGIANELLEPWIGVGLAKILVLVTLICFIQKHPYGLFALNGQGKAP